MKNSITSPFGTCEVNVKEFVYHFCLFRTEYSYPTDPRKFIFDFETQDVIDENVKWFDKVLENKNVEKFIEDLFAIKGTMMITPVNAFSIVDNNPYCWVFLAYDSDNTKSLKGRIPSGLG